jgi:multiple sugar transport system permease protein
VAARLSEAGNVSRRNRRPPRQRCQWRERNSPIDASTCFDAARIDGCSELGIFTRIIVPVIRPGLAALAVLTFINVYNDFVWPVVVTNDDRHQTLQVMLSTLAQNISSGQLGTDYGNVWGQTLAASTLASLPVLIFFIVLQRHFVNGLMAGSFKA